MMKRILLIAIFSLFLHFCLAQNTRRWDNKIDSLENVMNKATSDTVRLQASRELIDELINKAWIMTNSGRFPVAYESFGEAFKLWEDPNTLVLFETDDKNSGLKKMYWATLANLNFNYGHLMGVTGNTKERQFYYQKAFQIAKTWDDVTNIVYALSGIALVHLNNDELDSAKINMEIASAYPPELFDYEGYADFLFIKGSIELQSTQYDAAIKTFRQGVQIGLAQKYVISGATNNLGLSKAYRFLDNSDSSYFYGIQSLRTFKRIREIQMFDIDIASAYENLYDHFQKFNQPDSAFHYLVLAHSERHNLTRKKMANMAAFQQVLLDRQRELSDLKNENLAIQSKYRTYFFLAIIVVFLVIGAILLRGYHQKRKANLLLALQKDEVQATLNQLKDTQAQLIHQEKLASLGQLTAGIAHEIKNPLNFINNFSDLSRELIEEVFVELENLESSSTKEEIIAILQDVQSNLTKVHEHGTRADGIVTSMLQHSRASKSKREPKPFNPLVKEFVNLSYHGMRAGKAPINVDIDLQLDPQVGDVTMISEDFSRVILNLCNNAFDAMRDKLKLEVGNGKSEAYLPKLTVTTALQKDKVILSIGDNGGGIPLEIRDKILQPFFTTKKGTDGTGLGLSITNDIIKAHGGEIKVETKDKSGTKFLIILPLKGLSN
jgi:signal transduction histidine kinase